VQRIVDNLSREPFAEFVESASQWLESIRRERGFVRTSNVLVLLVRVLRNE